MPLPLTPNEVEGWWAWLDHERIPTWKLAYVYCNWLICSGRAPEVMRSKLEIIRKGIEILEIRDAARVRDQDVWLRKKLPPAYLAVKAYDGKETTAELKSLDDVPPWLRTEALKPGPAYHIFAEWGKTVFGIEPSKWPAFVEALTFDGLKGKKDWANADDPILWLKKITNRNQRRMDAPKVREADCMYRNEAEGRSVVSLDAPRRDGQDPLNALKPHPDSPDDVTVDIDLDSASKSAGLSKTARNFAKSEYQGIPLSVAKEELGISHREYERGRKELRAGKPALQDRLRPYREPKHSKSRKPKID